MPFVCLLTMRYLRLASNSRPSTTREALTPPMNSMRFWPIFIRKSNLSILLYLMSKISDDSFIFLDIEPSKIRETQYRVEKAIQDLLYYIKIHLGVGNRVCFTPFGWLPLHLSIPQAHSPRYCWYFQNIIQQEHTQHGASRNHYEVARD